MFASSGEFKIETLKYNTTVVASQKSGKSTNLKLFLLNCPEFTNNIPSFVQI